MSRKHAFYPYPACNEHRAAPQAFIERTLRKALRQVEFQHLYGQRQMTAAESEIVEETLQDLRKAVSLVATD